MQITKLEFDSLMSACFDSNGTPCIEHVGHARERLNGPHSAVRFCAGKTLRRVQQLLTAFASVADPLPRLDAVAVQE